MKRVIRKSLSVAAVALICASAVAQERVPPPVVPTPPPAPQPPPAASVLAATVNGQTIPEMAVYRALRPVPPAKHAEARGEILNFLIDNVLIDQYLRSLNVNVDKKDVDGRVDEMRSQLKRQNLEFDKVLKDMMLSEDELRTHITAELRWEKYVTTQASEAVLRDLFAKNIDMFDGSMVHARHVLLTPAAGDAKANQEAQAQLLGYRKQIEDAAAQGLAKLPATADNLTKEKERAKLIDEAFAGIAKQKSACPSKEQGGDIGWFPRTGSMVEPFAHAAFALKPYELSGVVTTQFGHHLILALERKAGQEKKFEDVKDDVKEVYAGRMREALVAQLRQKATIAIAPK